MFLSPRIKLFRGVQSFFTQWAEVALLSQQHRKRILCNLVGPAESSPFSTQHKLPIHEQGIATTPEQSCCQRIFFHFY